MLNELTLLMAQSSWPWYNWVLILAIVGVIVGYKIYQKKMMS
jgi:hypothetical protein